MFVIIHDDNVILGPMPWRKLFFENTLDEELGIVVVLPQKYDLKEPYVISGAVKIYPARYTEDSINPKIQKLNGPFWTFTDLEAVGHFVAVDRTIEEVKQQLKGIAADIRWKKEVGTVKMTIGEKEYSLETSREGRGVYLQALQLGAVSDWKFPEGWATLSLEDLQRAVTILFTHVQTCFEEEAITVAAIDEAVTLTALEALFPSSEEEDRNGRGLLDV